MQERRRKKRIVGKVEKWSRRLPSCLNWKAGCCVHMQSASCSKWSWRLASSSGCGSSTMASSWRQSLSACRTLALTRWTALSPGPLRRPSSPSTLRWLLPSPCSSTSSSSSTSSRSPSLTDWRSTTTPRSKTAGLGLSSYQPHNRLQNFHGRRRSLSKLGAMWTSPCRVGLFATPTPVRAMGIWL